MPKKVPSRAEAEQMFRSLDKSGDGTLSPKELTDYLKSHGYSHAQAVSFFDQIDDSDDKKISLEEFTEDICSAPRSEALTAAFDAADKDKSGKLTKDEIIAASKKAGLSDTQAIDAGFENMDADGSGYVDRDEFFQYMSEKY